MTRPCDDDRARDLRALRTAFDATARDAELDRLLRRRPPSTPDREDDVTGRLEEDER